MSDKLGDCLHCKTPLTSVEHIRRSVYGRPCGCRLYQGNGKDAAKVLAGLRAMLAAIEKQLGPLGSSPTENTAELPAMTSEQASMLYLATQLDRRLIEVETPGSAPAYSIMQVSAEFGAKGRNELDIAAALFQSLLDDGYVELVGPMRGYPRVKVYRVTESGIENSQAKR